MTEQKLVKLSDRIDAGVKAAIAEAIEKHRRLGRVNASSLGRIISG